MRFFSSSTLFFAFLFTALGAYGEPLSVESFFAKADPDFVFISSLNEDLSVPRAQRALARCEGDKALPTDLPACKLSQAMRSASSPLEQFTWPAIDAQVIYFGERHFDPEIKKFITDNIPALKAQGVATLAFEMFNSSQQAYLDDYVTGAISIEDLKVQLEKVWNYKSDAYLELIKTAKENGLRLLALDSRDIKTNGQISYFFEELYRRDLHMSSILASAVAKNPHQKIAVLAGRMHSFGSFSVPDLTMSQPEILRTQYGISTMSLLAFVGTDWSSLNSMHIAVAGPSAPASVVSMPKEYRYANYFLFFP